MHLQESTLFDLDLQVKVTLNVAQCLLHHVTLHLQNLKLLRQKLEEEKHLQEIQYLAFNLDFGVKVTQNVASTLYIM